MFWNNSRTFYNYLKWLARLSSSLRNRNRLGQHTATLFFDLPENTTLYTERMLKTALELLEIIMYNFQHKIWSQVQTRTHTLLSRKQSPGVSNLQRGWSSEYIFYSLTTFLNPWSERTHCMENGESNVFSRLTLPHVRLFCYSYATLNRFWEKKRRAVLQSSQHQSNLLLIGEMNRSRFIIKIT